uniref:Pollen allergen Cro s 1 n=1 Tax=Crocus sativus TaxID=82528 RepID=CROS1_CROSA|nr:RecName: Full=Pollen allergen Cro s 1; AltName: Allergen=Cro s 1; Flags: Precursor [Crocus sativus]AAX93750.1 pollen allergen Cro s 1 [Crocus sativus]
MGKCQAVFLLVGALCVLSLAGVANAAENHFKVQGMVYCDTCRIQFMTRVSTIMEGATVKLECRNITAGTQTFKAEAVTDKVGQYSIPVHGDFQDDICEIELVKSPNSECSEVSHDVYAKQSAKVSLTSNNGEASDIRSANALGFMRKEPLKECPEVLKELDLYDVKAN